jgi:hypothetical protein
MPAGDFRYGNMDNEQTIADRIDDLSIKLLTDGIERVTKSRRRVMVRPDPQTLLRIIRQIKSHPLPNGDKCRAIVRLLDVEFDSVLKNGMEIISGHKTRRTSPSAAMISSMQSWAAIRPRFDKHATTEAERRRVDNIEEAFRDGSLTTQV